MNFEKHLRSCGFLLSEKGTRNTKERETEQKIYTVTRNFTTRSIFEKNSRIENSPKKGTKKENKNFLPYFWRYKKEVLIFEHVKAELLRGALHFWDFKEKEENCIGQKTSNRLSSVMLLLAIKYCTPEAAAWKTEIIKALLKIGGKSFSGKFVKKNCLSDISYFSTDNTGSISYEKSVIFKGMVLSRRKIS